MCCLSIRPQTSHCPRPCSLPLSEDLAEKLRASRPGSIKPTCPVLDVALPETADVIVDSLRSLVSQNVNWHRCSLGVKSHLRLAVSPLRLNCRARHSVEAVDARPARSLRIDNSELATSAGTITSGVGNIGLPVDHNSTLSACCSK